MLCMTFTFFLWLESLDSICSCYDLIKLFVRHVAERLARKRNLFHIMPENEDICYYCWQEHWNLYEKRLSAQVVFVFFQNFRNSVWNVVTSNEDYFVLLCLKQQVSRWVFAFFDTEMTSNSLQLNLGSFVDSRKSWKSKFNILNPRWRFMVIN